VVDGTRLLIFNMIYHIGMISTKYAILDRTLPEIKKSVWLGFRYSLIFLVRF